MIKKLIVKNSLFVFLSWLIPFTASAFRIEYGGNVIISQPVYEDLYIAGGNITINAPIHGDLVVAGGTIIINDTIMNDILLAGGTVTFNGFVGDDIRCAGGNIHIGKNLSGDLVVTGGRIIIDKNVMIGGLLASGGNIIIDGNVNGKVKGVFGDLILNGDVLKDVDCRGGKITLNGTINGTSILAARNIIIGNNAVFNNDVRYWNKQGSLNFKQSLKQGRATYDPLLQTEQKEWYYLGATTIFSLLWYLGMVFVMLLIIQYLFSSTFKKAADNVFNKSLKSIGFGFLFFIAVPVIVIITFITLIGIPVGLLLTLSYICLLLLANTITSLIVANWLNNRNNYHWNYWRLVLAAFGVFIILKIIFLVPFVGALIIILLVCISFGSILLNIRWRKRKEELSFPTL